MKGWKNVHWNPFCQSVLLCSFSETNMYFLRVCPHRTPAAMAASVLYCNTLWRLEINPAPFPSNTMYSNTSGNAGGNASIDANARCVYRIITITVIIADVLLDLLSLLSHLCNPWPSLIILNSDSFLPLTPLIP